MLLDAYALVALLADEPAGDEVEALLREGGCRVVVVNLAEAIDISQRVHGISAADVRQALEPLFLDGALSAIVSEESDGWLAAELRGKYYDKDQQLSMADCFLLAHAIGSAQPIATSDPPVANVARSEGAVVMALPDSSGAQP
jgi:uncharacterized protein with PIN domain